MENLDAAEIALDELPREEQLARLYETCMRYASRGQLVGAAITVAQRHAALYWGCCARARAAGAPHEPAHAAADELLDDARRTPLRAVDPAPDRSA